MLRILIEYSNRLTFYQNTLNEEGTGRAALLAVMYEYIMQAQGPWRHGSVAKINGLGVSDLVALDPKSISFPRRCMDCEKVWRAVRTEQYIILEYIVQNAYRFVLPPLLFKKLFLMFHYFSHRTKPVVPSFMFCSIALFQQFQ